ncbi:hypothetical protein ASPZODRAFT_17167 [Penicilliopsis zonata CBS 506.65]|uniref:mitogen-activated protein kinase kinase n=1 Tax=Penicilliopsis zonata CBS 506.65 TaxID=1073090 RepID=A0A1L9SEZ1_9EURO|nr:hypothetical protein ASPZODRAFT_17167 [Penicilliopsis zonata CBS 506.65]OJJ45722.1 hypothetical protein ASPZODRAFT_17167 [Penicilliopsis zonata CBS 506.65]
METQREPLANFPPSPDEISDATDDDLSPSLTAGPQHAPVPSLRPGRDMMAGMTASSTPLGQLNIARNGPVISPRPVASMSAQGGGGLNQDIMAKMKAFSLSRQGMPPNLGHSISTGTIPTTSKGPLAATASPLANSSHPNTISAAAGGALAGGALVGRLPPGARPNNKNWVSAPSIPGSSPATARGSPAPGGGLAAKRKLGLRLSDVSGPSAASPGGSGSTDGSAAPKETAFTKYAEFIDTQTGTLNFKNKAILHSTGVEFSSGHSFKISLDEVDRLDELGKGNYGTVYKVRHSRPHLRKPGLGLSGIVSRPADDLNGTQSSPRLRPQDNGNLSGVIMAMKEIRLELDENKFAQIIMELEVLHRCLSPFIIDFYGAFFQEGAVYMCVEYMDGGSIDKLYEDGIPEPILRKIALSTVMGLKTLKDDHNIIHRDVKPTNILANTRGQIKICDFGVSGNLVASIAKTNIGCQSYMAPERISAGGVQAAGAGGGGGTYSVQSDVWSLGLTIIECAMGRYPYPPETYNNIFSQLHEIVHGDPPTLPETGYSEDAHAFVRACLDKNPKNRPSYAMLLRHPWLSPLLQPPQAPTPDDAPSSTETEDKEVATWVKDRLAKRQGGLQPDVEKPALHKPQEVPEWVHFLQKETCQVRRTAACLFALPETGDFMCLSTEGRESTGLGVSGFAKLTDWQEGACGHRFQDNVIPRIATSHEYVMDGLLAFAALHMALTDAPNRQEYIHAALQYQARAVSGLSAALSQTMDLEEPDAAFVCSLLILVFATAYPEVSLDRDYPVDPLAEVLETRRLMTGCAFFFIQMNGTTEAAELKRWLNICLSRDNVIVTLSEPSRVLMSTASLDDTPELNKLHRGMKPKIALFQTILDKRLRPHQEVCRDAFQNLRRGIEPWPMQDTHGGVISWPAQLTEEFVSLAKNGDSLARMVLLFYGLSMHLFSNRWFAQGTGSRLILGLCPMFNSDDEYPELADIAAWARKMIDDH